VEESLYFVSIVIIFYRQQQENDSCDYDDAPQGGKYDEWMMG
jgi:hypothetical protein